MGTNMTSVNQTSLKMLNSLFESRYEEYKSFAAFKAEEKNFYFGVGPDEIVHLAYIYARDYVVPRGYVSKKPLHKVILKIIEQRMVEFVRREGKRKTVESNYCVAQYDSSEGEYLNLVKEVASSLEDDGLAFTILAMGGTRQQALRCVKGLTNYSFYNHLKERIETKTKQKVEESWRT